MSRINALRIIAVVFLILIAGAVFASCRTITIFQPDGSVSICQECCDGNGNCTITCF